LRDEVDFLEPVLASAGAPLFLVGHSYGAAVALVAALASPGRVRALALYEPTLFSVLDAEAPAPNAADGIREVVANVAAAIAAGNTDRAAELFIDYWAGVGAWRWIPDARKPAIVASMANAHHWGDALFGEPAPLGAFALLDIPVLYLVGKSSTPSALGVARLLTGALPRVEVVEFDGLGHMGPVTHPQTVNDVIAGFLEAQASPSLTGSV
jgi:pimeloyl-ACP methyl ester carboxylesterase